MQMVNRPGDEAVKKFRSSSVMLDEAEEVFPRMDNAATHAGNDGELPENVRAALMKAKEVVEQHLERGLTVSKYTLQNVDL